MTFDFVQNIKNAINEAITQLGYNDPNLEIVIEIPRDSSHGDYATNVAMRLARIARKAPLVIAKKIAETIKDNDLFEVSIAGAGFINFTLNPQYLLKVVTEVINQQDQYGNLTVGENQKINLEFVSANPTGYLHLGHCRGAAYGDSLARIMKKAGYDVFKEHYVNDAGNQITNMALSVYERYKELFGYHPEMLDDYYHGKEIIAIAETLKAEYNDQYLNNFDLEFFKEYGTKILLNQLKTDLKRFNVDFDCWFSEKSLYQQQVVSNTLNKLITDGYTYQEDGAIWLKTSLYGDDKDRVIVKSDGSYTYLLPDIGYHANKLSRGFDHLIDVLGADHHGYVARLKAAVSMIGGNSDLIDVEILQMVRVLENGEEVKMSKRSGKAITLSDLIDEVGTDVLRYFFVCKSLSTHMDLDLDLMRKKSNENPLFYAQYAHARIASLFRNFEKNHQEFVPQTEFNSLDVNKVKNICLAILRYPYLIKEIANTRLVHKMTNYIDELAYTLHSFYNDQKVISDDLQATQERLTILKALQIVLKNALELVGIVPCEQM